MSKLDLKLTVTGVPSGTDASSGSVMSRLCPAFGAQPKSFPRPDHQTYGAEACASTFAGSMTSFRGSFSA
jgi:hypothetical protein